MRASAIRSLYAHHHAEVAIAAETAAQLAELNFTLKSLVIIITALGVANSQNEEKTMTFLLEGLECLNDEYSDDDSDDDICIVGSEGEANESSDRGGVGAAESR